MAKLTLHNETVLRKGGAVILLKNETKSAKVSNPLSFVMIIVSFG